MRIAMIAPPWIKLPPNGYGGIEEVVWLQLGELAKQGHKITVFTVGESEAPPGVDVYSCFETGLYEHIGRPLNEAIGITTAHLLAALNTIHRRGNFDIIHDNTGFVGNLAALSCLDRAFPPVLHTFHGAVTTENDEYGVAALIEVATATGKLYFNGISQSQLDAVPAELRQALRSRLLGVVYNPVQCATLVPSVTRQDYFVMLARITPDKGQDVAVRCCLELGVPLVLAGPVTNQKYFETEVEPYIDNRQIKYHENVGGEEKHQLLAGALGFLTPHNWSEPFGMAPLEANACGTPVIATALGALTETISPGVNGYLVDPGDGFEERFTAVMQKAGEIDRQACQDVVRKRFAPAVNAAQYLKLYRNVIKRAKASRC